MKLNKAVIGICVLWFMLISGFLFAQLLPFMNGSVVFLKVRPRDPLNMFRGKYVYLTYDISSIPYSKIYKVGSEIYVVLEKDKDGFATYKYSTLSKPENELFIRGKIQYNNLYNKDKTSNVHYGIEHFYVPEKSAKQIEKNRFEGLYAEILLSKDGASRLKRLVY